jgi:outer membrane lipopolysaccharide assembly protein LptE/RlpB|tara:strand:+ start:663 stop:1121 length:459 start_codon:yes stop_codon:yes gene_type:complete
MRASLFFFSLLLISCSFKPSDFQNKKFFVETSFSKIERNESRLFLRELSKYSNLQHADGIKIKIDILKLQFNKNIISISSTGDVKEYELDLIFSYTLEKVNKDIIEQTIQINRAMTYDYTFDLSKEAEENLIRKSMINEAISQLHNRLARIL